MAFIYAISTSFFTKLLTLFLHNVLYTKSGNSSVGRAQPCQGWGREFESRFPLHFPSLSRPLRAKARFQAYPARWQSGYAADCNSVYAGSIPTRASIFLLFTAPYYVEALPAGRLVLCGFQSNRLRQGAPYHVTGCHTDQCCHRPDQATHQAANKHQYHAFHTDSSCLPGNCIDPSIGHCVRRWVDPLVLSRQNTVH